MRILLTSDWHIDAVTAGLERFDDVSMYVDEVVAACERERIDLVCFLGDAFDPGSLREGLYSSFMVRTAHRLATAATYGAIMIAGNHDVIDVSTPCSTLSPVAAMAETAAFQTGLGDKFLAVAERVTFYATREPVGILAFPYVSRAVLWTDSFLRDSKFAFDAAREWKAAGKKVVVISHLDVPGAVPGSEDEMPRGRVVPLPVERLRDLGPDLVVNGHYHARQVVDCGGLPVQIVGAPARFTFGEARDGERGFLIAEL